MKTVIYIILLIGISFDGFAQKELDSILKKAYSEVYENPESAINIGLEIFNKQKATQETKIEALLLITTGYSSQRNYAKSLEYAVMAAELLPKVNDDAFKINVYSRHGIQYQQLKIYNKAHSYLDMAITVASNSKQKFNTHKLLGFNYAIRGMVYKEQMSCDIAQNYFNKSLYHNRKCDEASISYANISVILYNKGNCFLSLNEIDSARICYTDSYSNANRIDANSLRAFANKGLAEVNTFEGQYESAIQLLLDASKMSESVGDLVLNQGIYKGLSDNYLLTNNIIEHEKFNRKYEQTSQLIRKSDITTLNKFIVRINAETESEVDQVKSASLLYKILLIALVILLAGLLILEIIRAQKKYKRLKQQKKILESIPSARG